MDLMSALIIAVLFGCAVYLILDLSLIKILFGFALLTHACNLFILSVSGNPIGKLAPIIDNPAHDFVDPLPQALILTAIVIGFGITAFMIVYFYKLFTVEKTTNTKEIYTDVQ